MANPRHAAQMTDEQILDSIDSNPRLAHITAAARRSTPVDVPTEDPRSYKRAVQYRTERDALMASLPPQPSHLGHIFKALADDAD